MLDLVSIFESFWETISAFFRYWLNSLDDTFYIIKLILHFVGNIPTYFFWIPSEILAIVVAGFSIIVIMRLISMAVDVFL